MTTHTTANPGRPVDRVLDLAFRGIRVMTGIGALEGIVIGPIATIAMRGEPGIALTVGLFLGMIATLLLGIPVGFLSFGAAGMICRHMPRRDEMMRRLEAAAVRGSVVGAGLGGLLGALLHRMAPGNVSAGEGYLCGTALGLLIGTLAGAVHSAGVEAARDAGTWTPSPEDPAESRDRVHLRITRTDQEAGAERLGLRSGDSAEIVNTDDGELHVRLALASPVTRVELVIPDGDRSGSALPPR